MSRYEDYVRKRFPKNIADTAMKYFGKSFAVEEIKDKILNLFDTIKDSYINEDCELVYVESEDVLTVDIEIKKGKYVASIKRNDRVCSFCAIGGTNIINDSFGYEACFRATNKKEALEGLYENCCGLLRRKYELFANDSMVHNKYEDIPERINAVVKFEYHMKKEPKRALLLKHHNNN